MSLKMSLQHCVIGVLVLLSTSCNREPEVAIMTMYQGGHEYEILERGDTYDNGKPAYLLRYFSEKPNDQSVLMAESADLLVIISKSIDTNKHERVILEAVEKKGPLFGLLKPREVRQSMTVEDVLAYKPAAKK